MYIKDQDSTDPTFTDLDGLTWLTTTLTDFDNVNTDWSEWMMNEWWINEKQTIEVDSI